MGKNVEIDKIGESCKISKIGKISYVGDTSKVDKTILSWVRFLWTVTLVRQLRLVKKFKIG